METFSALLAICVGNSLVPGEFPTQRPVTRSFDVFFDQRLNKRLSKQSWGWWFEMLSCPLWRHSNEFDSFLVHHYSKLIPWTHFINGKWAHNWNLMKIIIALIMILINQWGHEFASHDSWKVFWKRKEVYNSVNNVYTLSDMTMSCL